MDLTHVRKELKANFEENLAEYHEWQCFPECHPYLDSQIMIQKSLQLVHLSNKFQVIKHLENLFFRLYFLIKHSIKVIQFSLILAFLKNTLLFLFELNKVILVVVNLKHVVVIFLIIIRELKMIPNEYSHKVKLNHNLIFHKN